MFNFKDVEPQSNEFKLLPMGEYVVAIVDAEIKESKKNSDNKYISATFEVVEGNYTRRKIFEMYNVINSNETARRIAYSQIKSIMEAIKSNKTEFNTLEDIIAEISNKPMKCYVGIRKDEQYGDKNVIKSYKPLTMGSGQDNINDGNIPF